jgi:hypothetical protein
VRDALRGDASILRLDRQADHADLTAALATAIGHWKVDVDRGSDPTKSTALLELIHAVKAAPSCP